MPSTDESPCRSCVVSIIIATYRASDHLAQAIRSAVNQTLTDIEIIVSDDANDPAVAELVRSFSDPRIIYRSNAARLGPAGNHWAAFADASGEYLAVLNHDDLEMPTFAERLADVLKSMPDVVMAFCDHDVIDSNGASLKSEADELSLRWGRTHLPTGIHRDTAALVVKGTVPSAVGAMFRRSALPRFPDFDPAGAYDLYLSAKLAETGKAFYYVAERLTAWRVHPAQLTEQPDRPWAQGSLSCWKEMSASGAFASQRRVVRRSLARGYYRVGRLDWKIGDFGSARRNAVAAIGHDLFHGRSWVLMVMAVTRGCLPTGQRLPVSTVKQPDAEEVLGD